jgi:hypothetical protein
MRVAFCTQVVSEPTAFRYLTALLWMFIDDRHTWCVEDLAPIKRSLWLRDAAQSVRKAALELLPKVARRLGKPDLLVVPHGQTVGYDTRDNVWRAAPEAAAWHLGRPLLLIVENALCDGAFIRLVMTRVAQRRVRRALGSTTFDLVNRGWAASPLGDGRWFEVRHGGGATTARQLDLAVQQTPNLPPRVFVLLDSDRAARGADLGQTAKDVQAIVNKLNESLPAPWRIRPVVLLKHEVENYLPKEILQARYGGRPAFNDWLQLSDEQRDYIDIKQHFEDRPWKLFIEPNLQRHLHEAALRKRAGDGGRELDDLASAIITKL